MTKEYSIVFNAAHEYTSYSVRHRIYAQPLTTAEFTTKSTVPSTESSPWTDTTSVSVFAPIAAPILRTVDPVRVATFLKERERYELEIEFKQLQIPMFRAFPY